MGRQETPSPLKFPEPESAGVQQPTRAEILNHISNLEDQLSEYLKSDTIALETFHDSIWLFRMLKTVRAFMNEEGVDVVPPLPPSRDIPPLWWEHFFRFLVEKGDIPVGWMDRWQPPGHRKEEYHYYLNYGRQIEQQPKKSAEASSGQTGESSKQTAGGSFVATGGQKRTGSHASSSPQPGAPATSKSAPDPKKTKMTAHPNEDLYWEGSQSSFSPSPPSTVISPSS